MNTQDGARVEMQSLEGHRRILGILFLVMNALTLLVALGFGAVMLFMGQLGMGILAIPNMPLGTALGIYAIWFYTQPGSDRVFE